MKSEGQNARIRERWSKLEAENRGRGKRARRRGREEERTGGILHEISECVRGVCLAREDKNRLLRAKYSADHRTSEME